METVKCEDCGRKITALTEEAAYEMLGEHFEVCHLDTSDYPED